MDMFTSKGPLVLDGDAKLRMDVAVARYIVAENLAQDHTNRPGFQQLLDAARADSRKQYKTPSRELVVKLRGEMRDVISSFYKEQILGAVEARRGDPVIALQEDMWKAPTKKAESFLGAHVHWVDPVTEEVKTLQLPLRFESSAHSSQGMAAATRAAFREEFGRTKAFNELCGALASDGAGDMVSTGRCLKVDWVWGWAHRLNLAVGDAMNGSVSVVDYDTNRRKFVFGKDAEALETDANDEDVAMAPLPDGEKEEGEEEEEEEEEEVVEKKKKKKAVRLGQGVRVLWEHDLDKAKTFKTSLTDVSEEEAEHLRNVMEELDGAGKRSAYAHRSTKAMTQVVEAQKGGKVRQPIRNNPTRWSSSYLMLARDVELTDAYTTAFTALKMKKYAPKAETLDLRRELVAVLEPVHVVSKQLQGAHVGIAQAVKLINKLKLDLLKAFTSSTIGSMDLDTLEGPLLAKRLVIALQLRFPERKSDLELAAVLLDHDQRRLYVAKLHPFKNELPRATQVLVAYCKDILDSEKARNATAIVEPAQGGPDQDSAAGSGADDADDVDDNEDAAEDGDEDEEDEDEEDEDEEDEDGGKPAQAALQSKKRKSDLAAMGMDMSTLAHLDTSAGLESLNSKCKSKGGLKFTLQLNVSAVRAKAEVKKYLAFESGEVNSDAEFWRDNKDEFPLLARLRARIHAIPCATARTESLFSVAKNILAPQRQGNMKPRTVSEVAYVKANAFLVPQLEQLTLELHHANDKRRKKKRHADVDLSKTKKKKAQIYD